jgi:hypothetical protein
MRNPRREFNRVAPHPDEWRTGRRETVPAANAAKV